MISIRFIKRCNHRKLTQLIEETLEEIMAVHEDIEALKGAALANTDTMNAIIALVNSLKAGAVSAEDAQSLKDSVNAIVNNNSNGNGALQP